MGHVLVTPPASEPVTVLEAVNRLRLDVSNLLPPPTAPTVALVTATGNVTAGAHRYRVTFVTADGETDGGVISAAVTTIAGVADDPMTLDVDETVVEKKQVSLTAIPLGPTGVTARKIYRTAANGSAYLLLATLANNTATTYTDNIADGSLGVGIPTTNTAYDMSEVAPLITAARQSIEENLGRAFPRQQWKLTLDAWPSTGIIELPRPPLASLVEDMGDDLTTSNGITYVDHDGNTQTLDPASYVVDATSTPARIGPAVGVTWPALANRIAVVSVTYTAGVTAVDEQIKQAILLIVGDLYKNREAQADDVLNENRTVQWLLEPFRYRLVA
jgi:uncharacterized phiE125 gp8 family phage protein